MFTFNGKKSTDFGLKVLSQLELTSAEQDITLKEISGIDGDVVVDNKRLKGVNRSFPCQLKLKKNQTIETAAQQITSWLRPKKVSWYPLEWVGDPNYQYLAVHYEQYELSRILKHFGKCVITFRCKPVKYLKASLKEITLTNNQVLNNTENTEAKPLITVTGNGAITFFIGRQKLTLVEVDKGVIIDCQSQSILTLDGRREAWSTMNDGQFPVIEHGPQTVRWTGNVTQVKMIPRLGAKV